MKNFKTALSVFIPLALLAVLSVFVIGPAVMQAGNPVQVSGSQFVGTDGNGAIYTGQFIRWDGNQYLLPATGASDSVTGVATSDASPGQTVYFAGPGQWASVRTVTAVNRGDLLVSDANGRAVTMTAAQRSDPNLIGSYRPCAISFQSMPADPNGFLIRVYLIAPR